MVCVCVICVCVCLGRGVVLFLCVLWCAYECLNISPYMCISVCLCLDYPKGDPCDVNPCLEDGQTCVFNTSSPDDFHCECAPGFKNVMGASNLTCIGGFYEHSICNAVFIIIRYVSTFFTLPFRLKMTNIIFTLLVRNILQLRHLTAPSCQLQKRSSYIKASLKK